MKQFFFIDSTTYKADDNQLVLHDGAQWVLRDFDGKIIDRDNFRHDLAERNNIKLVHSAES